jgi:5'-nucleotidase
VFLLLFSFVSPALGAADLPTGQFVILHTNDGHGRGVDSGGYGISGVAALKAEYEAEGAEVLLLDAGDTLHGLPFATLDKGVATGKLMVLAGYDAMTPGNHDFNYGASYLVDFAKTVPFPILSTNVKDKTSGTNLFTPYTLIKKGGKTFGIFGLTTPETSYKTNPLNEANVIFSDPVAAAKDAVAALQKENVDYIIALAHIGVDTSSEITSYDILKDVDGIDIFVDAHSHTEFPEGELVNGALLVSTGDYYRNIGIVTIQADGALSASLLTPGQREDLRSPEIDALADSVAADRDVILREVVAHTSVDLYGSQK